MFIVYGTKRKVRSLGWVADFCPICRRPQPFELIRIGLASHIYYISFGQGKLAGHEMNCQGCATKLPTDEMRYAAQLKSAGSDFAVLASATMPNMPEILGERLALEKTIASGAAEMDPNARKDLLLEPFIILERMLRERQGANELDRHSGIGCLGTIMVIGGFAACLIFAKPQARTVDLLIKAGGIVVALGTIYTLIQMGLTMRRYVRSQVYPRLVTSLAKLRPSETDIADTLAVCKKAKMKIAKAVKPDALRRELQRG